MAAYYVAVPHPVALLLLGNASLHGVEGLRAFVSAERLWSKSQKIAVGHLAQYAQTRNEDSYQGYREEMAVATGLRNARIELDKPVPDFEVARQGLRDARNDPEDVESMIALYRRFRNVDFMATTIAIWAQADAQIEALDAAAKALHSAIVAGNIRAADIQALAGRVRTLDQQLTPWEEAFSATLEEVSRKATRMLALTNVVVAILLVLIVVVRTRGLIREGEAFESELRDSEERFEYAVVASNDGIWDWTLKSDFLYFSPRFEELMGYPPGTMRETLDRS
jgi:PAS domain-containing protein